MLPPTTNRKVILSIFLACLLVGCDERVAKVAREAADRQAEQNRTMARLQHDVADGTRQLVAADSNARDRFASVHRDIQSERADMNRQWAELAKERAAVTAERRRLASWAPAFEAGSAIVLVIVVIGFCWHVLVRLPAGDVNDAELAELLLAELAGQGELRLLAADFPPEIRTSVPESPTPFFPTPPGGTHA